MKPVVMTPAEWLKVLSRIKEDYPPSVSLLTWKRKEKLGFTVREHSQWVVNRDYDRQYKEYESREKTGFFFNIAPERGSTEHVVCLDFYDEKKRTMFLLKYGELIQSEHIWNKSR